MAVLLEKDFPVEAGAFTTAGEASTTIKRTLKQLGINIPQEQINKLIELVKEKLGDQTTKSILDKIKSFFKK